MPRGEYKVSAAKDGFISLEHGQQRAFESGKPVFVGDDEIIDKIDFALPRGGVIAGVVSDPFGDPIIGATVRPLRAEWRRGHQEFVSARPTITTNDLGEFRVYSLPPGEFFLAATTRLPFGVANADSGYVPTYYPGTASMSEIQPVVVGLSQTVSNLSIQMVPARVVRISGVAVDPDGQPLVSGFLNVALRAGGGSLAISAGQLKKDGSFAISGVPPGEYVLHIDSTSPGPNSEYRTAATVVTAGTENIDGIRLQVSPMGTATGRLVVDPTSRASLQPTTIRVGPQSTNVDDIVTYILDKPVKEDSSFQFRTVSGLVNVRCPSLPPGWNLRAVRLHGIDVTDSGIEFRPAESIDGIEVELTDRFPQLNGRVLDDKSDPVMDYTVLVFSTNPDRWAWNSRYVATARPGRRGTFEVDSLPAGDYFVLAREYMKPGQWMDAKFLESMSHGAVKTTLRDAQATTIELRLPR